MTTTNDRVCDYCGKSNRDGDVRCAECGTAFVVPADPSTALTAKKPKLPKTLNARSAIVVAVLFLAASALCSCITTIIVNVNPGIFPTTLLFNYVFSGIVMVYFSFKLVPNQIKDTSPTGAAWVIGTRPTVFFGFCIGLLIGLCNEAVIIFGKHYVLHKDLNPKDQLLYGQLPTRVIWLLISVVLAPTIEEMLFRGVLYGGFRKSFGLHAAAIITTCLFVIMHFPNYAHFFSNVVFVTIGAFATLWCRLHWSAIGPAIAAHSGYNATAFLVAMIWKNR